MAHAQTRREAWIEEGLRALAEGGPEAVKIEALATRLGVTKGGFYGYFADRATLLTEMLDTWEQGVTIDLIGQVESQDGGGRDKLDRLGKLADATSEPTADMALDLAIRYWARHDEGVARRLRQVDQRRMGYLRTLFADFCADDDEVELRATLAFALWLADGLVDFDYGGRSREEFRRLSDRYLLS